MKNSKKSQQSIRKKECFNAIEIDKSKPTYLLWDLKRDYKTLMCQISWKILFIRRKLEKVQQKYHNTGASSVNERRLKYQLVRTIRLLDIIKDRLHYVERSEELERLLVQTYDQRANISNVYDLDVQKYGLYDF